MRQRSQFLNSLRASTPLTHWPRLPGWPAGLWRAGAGALRRHWLIPAIVLGLVVVVAYTAAFLIDEPLRRYTEAKVNRALKGYTASIGKLDSHPLGFSLDLRDVTVVQDAHPDPAVLRIARLSASVHWRALLRGRLVADFEFVRPTVYLNLPQVRKEINDPAPVEERGWQEALEAIYPLKINHFEIIDGDVTYIDNGPYKPLHLRDLDVVATNIRNVRSRRRPYPSELRASAVVFESGRVAVEGRANFLAVPHATFRGDVQLTDIALDYFKPITNRYNVSVSQGTLSAAGAVEYGLETTTVELKQAIIDGISVDYVHTARTDAVEKERAGQAKQAVKEVSNKPGVLINIDELRVTRSTVGFVNKATTPPYRLFLSQAEGTLKNLSNHESAGTATARLRGKLMGSGAVEAEATYRSEKASPAFDVAIRMEDVSVPTLNDLLRAYGRFDAASGQFSFYTELSAKNGAITGYVKPIFKDIRIYATEQEQGKPLMRKVYERVVSGVAKLLENRTRNQVATKSEISGRLDNPKISTIEVVLGLVQNAFFKAILPGFDFESHRAERVRRAAGS